MAIAEIYTKCDVRGDGYTICPAGANDVIIERPED